MHIKKQIKKPILNLLIIILTLIIATNIIGCSNTLYAEELSNNSEIDNTNLDEIGDNSIAYNKSNQEKTCSENQILKDNECVCKSGYKLCNKKCIKEDDCCTNNDCTSPQKCEKNQCVGSCKNVFCSLNSICDNGLCVCKEGTYWCEKQKRCIEDSQCCDAYSCAENRDRKVCDPIVISAEICIENDSKSCKYIPEKGSRIFYLDNQYQISVLDVFEGPLFDIRINNQTMEKINVETKKDIDSMQIWVNSLKYKGGICKERD